MWQSSFNKLFLATRSLRNNNSLHPFLSNQQFLKININQFKNNFKVLLNMFKCCFECSTKHAKPVYTPCTNSRLGWYVEILEWVTLDSSCEYILTQCRVQSTWHDQPLGHHSLGWGKCTMVWNNKCWEISLCVQWNKELLCSNDV